MGSSSWWVRNLKNYVSWSPENHLNHPPPFLGSNILIFQGVSFFFGGERVKEGGGTRVQKHVPDPTGLPWIYTSLMVQKSGTSWGNGSFFFHCLHGFYAKWLFGNSEPSTLGTWGTLTTWNLVKTQENNGLRPAQNTETATAKLET